MKKFASITDSLLECDKVFLHGDQYFDAIDPYFEQSDLGGNLVRAKKVIADSVVQALGKTLCFSRLRAVKITGRSNKYL